MTLDFGVLVPAGTVVVAVAGLVFAALRYNREDAGKVISQQSAVLRDMQALNQQLHADLERAQAERDMLLLERKEYDEKIQALNDKIEDLKGQISDLERRMRGADESTRP